MYYSKHTLRKKLIIKHLRIADHLYVPDTAFKSLVSICCVVLCTGVYALLGKVPLLKNAVMRKHHYVMHVTCTWYTQYHVQGPFQVKSVLN